MSDVVYPFWPASVALVDKDGKLTRQACQSFNNLARVIGGSSGFIPQHLTITFDSGTVSAPSITFSNDDDSGFYSPSAGVIGGVVNGVEIYRFSSSGIKIDALIDGAFIYNNTSGYIATTAAATNGQLLIGGTGTNPVAATLTGTVNQVNVTNAAGSITLSTPQDIATTSSPTFVAETLSGTTASKLLWVDSLKKTTTTGTSQVTKRFYGGPISGADAEPTFRVLELTDLPSGITASNVEVVDAGGDTTTWVMLATAQTGSVAPASDAGLTYNATTNALTATTFIGALTGNASTVTTNANLTGPITSVGNATSVAAQTGTGSTFVMQASPTLTAPDIGTPTAGVLTSCTGTAQGLTAGGDTSFPLMNYNGYQFDGATDYLDGNALTGIADGKKGTMFVMLRFANAASATEVIQQSTGARLQLTRSSTGDIQILARNSAATVILTQILTGTPCAAAGTYSILVSWDMAAGQSSVKMYVNDVTNTITNTTFTDDTIDYTAAEYSIGASVTGTAFFTGDIYEFWLDSTSNIDFSSAANRRKFTTAANVPVFLGSSGELPTGTAPILYLGLGPYTLWPKNRGSAVSTNFVENGTPGAVGTALYGQYAPFTGRYTPVLTNTTNITASTAYECNYQWTSGGAIVSGKIDADPTIAGSCVLGMSFPFASAITAAEQCAGTAFCPAIAGQGAAILGDLTNDRATMQWIAVDVTNQPMYFSYFYRIL